MAKRRYALERGGPKRLELRWRWRMKQVEVALDGQAWKLDRAAVLAGAPVTIPGGSTLRVQLVRRRWWSIALRDDLVVELDGVPVPGSDGHPRVVGRRAASVIALFGLLRVVFIGLWLVFNRGGARGSGNVGIMLTGAALIVLAPLAAFGLRTAVLLAAGLLVLEGVASVALAGARASPLGVVVQVLVVVHLYGAWKRMRPRPPAPTLAQVFE